MGVVVVLVGIALANNSDVNGLYTVFLGGLIIFVSFAEDIE